MQRKTDLQLGPSTPAAFDIMDFMAWKSCLISISEKENVFLPQYFPFVILSALTPQILLVLVVYLSSNHLYLKVQQVNFSTKTAFVPTKPWLIPIFARCLLWMLEKCTDMPFFLRTVAVARFLWRIYLIRLLVYLIFAICNEFYRKYDLAFL